MAKAEPNKNDARYLATQERIEETFWDLLADGGFPKITVRALSERAGINRGTFYLHAEDKYDLLSQVEDRMHQGMMGGGARLASGDAPEGEAPPMAAPMIAGARFAYENRERMLLLMDDSCDPLFFSKYAAKVKEAMLGATGDLTSEQRYALALMEGVIGSFFGEWVRGGDERDARGVRGHRVGPRCEARLDLHFGCAPAGAASEEVLTSLAHGG